MPTPNPRSDIFDLMVRYHISSNLPACLPCHDGEGVIRPAANENMPVPEGEENFQYRGMLVFQNGSTLLSHLLRDGYVKSPLDIFDGPDAKRVATPEDAYDFFRARHSGDGVHVYESEAQEMIRVAKVREPETRFSQRLPAHFVHFRRESSSDLERELRQGVGTKTRLATALPERYDHVIATQIKQSGYTSLGMGQVVEIGPEGLQRAFFFRYIANPHDEVPFLVPEHRIAGVMRSYEQQGERRVLTDERFVDPAEYGVRQKEQRRDRQAAA